MERINNQTHDEAVSLPVTDRWFAVHCQPHREKLAEAHLRKQNYSTFLPLRRTTRRHARRIDEVTRPFFPGYLFVALDPERDPWRAINGTVGVVRLVAQGDSPTPAPVGVVEAIRRNCNDADILAWQPSLEPGDAVRVTEGPFAELIGTLDRLDGPARVRVLLNLLGGEVPVLLPRTGVVPATSFV